MEAQAIEAGADFLEGLLDRLSLDIDVEVDEEIRDEHVVYTLQGKDVARLRREAELVSALTLLTAQAASRQVGERVRCLLDVGGTFEARRELLETAARDLANAVERTGRIGVLDSLNSSERRVVHLALKDDPRVETRSESAGPRRMLLIEPGEEA